MNPIYKYIIQKENSLKLTAILSLLLFCQLATAQLYPVQVNQTLIPPYNTNLNSYVNTTDVKLYLYLIMTDVNINNRQVRLKLKIKGQGINIQSTDFVTDAPSVFLNGGTQTQLTNIDLAPYFLLKNLVGITTQQYNQPLPEGNYIICWEVYDYITNQLISNPNIGCTNIFLILNDPPFLNIPKRGEQITKQNFTNINFQWTPRQTNATNVTYDFEIREVWDNQIDPQAAFLSSPNYYSETTRATTLLYNISKPVLLPNKTYAWRVHAKSTTGISENSVFKNNGYSQIFYFTINNSCSPPLYPLSEAISTKNLKIKWQANTKHNKYNVQYKREDVKDAEWFEVFTYNNQTRISNLEPGVTYYFRVGATCDALTNLQQSYVYTAINKFTMPTANEKANYNCGIAPEIKITNTKPIQSIDVNQTFTAGDFPVTVKQITASGGTFKGTGYIVVPYLADTKIAVKFNGIKINTDYQLYDGVINTTYDPTWKNVKSVDGLVDDVKDLTKNIKQLLNLDIDKTTKEKIKKIVDIVKDGIQKDYLPDGIKNKATKALNSYQEKVSVYKDAQDKLEKAKKSGNKNTIETAKKQLDNYKKELDKANNNVKEVTKEIKQYKKQVADLLKKAIYKIYRNGKETSEGDANKISEIIQNQKNVKDENFFVMDSEYLEEIKTTQVSKAQKELNTRELKLGVYLFAKVLTEAEIESDTFKNFLRKLKNQKVDFLKEIKEKREANEDENKIVDFLVEKLKNMFTNILIEKN